MSKKSCIHHHSSKVRPEQILNGKTTAACNLVRFNINISSSTLIFHFCLFVCLFVVCRLRNAYRVAGQLLDNLSLISAPQTRLSMSTLCALQLLLLLLLLLLI